MTRKTRKSTLAGAVAGVTLLSVLSTTRAVNLTWDGGGSADTSWTTAANWNPDQIPGSADDLLFNSSSTVQNTLNTALTVNSLRYTLGVGGSRSTLFNGNVTVQSNVAANADAFAITTTNNSGNSTTTLTGPGILTVNSANGNFRIAADGAAGGNTQVTADLTGLGGLNVTVANFRLGVSASGGDLGERSQLLVQFPTGASAVTNITANLFRIQSGSAGTVRPAYVYLGTATTMHVDTIQIGGNRNGVNFLGFNTAASFTGSLTITGRNNTAADLTIGGAGGGTNSSGPRATLDLTTNAAIGGLKLTLNNLTIGASTPLTSSLNFAAATDTTSTMTANSISIATGSAAGALTINGGIVTSAGTVNLGTGSGGTGTLAVNNSGIFRVMAGGLNIGSNNGTTATTSTMTLSNNASATIAGGITMANSGSAALVLNNSAALTLTGGNITNSYGTATITVNAGTTTDTAATLNMGGGNIGDSSSPVTNVILTGGTITNVANLYTSGINAASTATTATLGTGSLTINSGGTMQIANSASTGVFHAEGVNLTLSGGNTLDMQTNVNFTPTADTLALNGLTLGSSPATFKFDYGTGKVDSLTLNGLNTLAINYSGKSTIDVALIPNAPVLPGVFPLLTYSGGQFTLNGAPTTDTGNLLANTYFQLNAPSVQNTSFSLISDASGLSLKVAATVGWQGPGVNWTDAANWSSTVPQMAGDAANFLGTAGAFHVNLNANETVGSVTFDSSSPYLLDSNNGSILTFAQADTSNAYLNVLNTAHTVGVPLVLNNNLLVTIPGAASLTLTSAATVSGSGTLTVGGNGTLIMGSATQLQNTTVLVNSGKLDTSGLAPTLGGLGGAAGTVDMKGTTLTVGNNNLDTSFGGVLMSSVGSGVLVKVGSGRLLLTGSSTFTGGVQLNAGTLAITANAASLGASTAALTFTGAGTLQAAASGINFSRSIVVNSGVSGKIDTQGNTMTVSGIISGAGGINKIGTGTLLLTGSNTYSGATTLTAGYTSITSLSNLGSAPSLVFAGGILNLSNPLPSGIDINALPTDYNNFNGGFNIPANTATTLVFSHAIAGTGAFIKAGASTMTLSGANAHTGGTQVLGGTLIVGSVTALGTGPVTMASGATLNLNGYSPTIGGLTGSGGTITSTAPATAITLTVNPPSGSALAAYTGVINNGSGTLNLVKTGAGTLTLGNGNGYTGGTTINGGILTLANTEGLTNGTWLGPVTAPVTIAGGQLTLSGNTGSTSPTYMTFANPVVVSGSGTILGMQRGTFAPATITADTNTTLTYQVKYVRGWIAGDWSGFNGVLNITSTGSAAGTGEANEEFRLQSSVNLANARVVLNDYAHLTNDTTGTPTYNIGALSSTSTSSSIGGGNSGQSAIWGVGALNLNTTFAGTIASPAILVKNGTGSFTILGAGTYAGGTTINGGSIITGNGSALGTGPVTMTAGTLDISGNYLTIGGLGGTAGLVTNNSAGSLGYLAVAQTADSTFAGNIQNGAGTLSLIKDGTSTLVLSGTNTYTGGTTIMNGTLMITSPAALAGSSGSIYPSNGVLALGYAIDQSFLTNRINSGYASNMFTVALGASSSNSLNFNTANFTNASLAAVGDVTMSGTFTPNGTTYRFGGASGTLTLTQPLVNNGGTTGVEIGMMSGPSLGTIVFAGNNTYTGQTNINAGRLSISSINNLGTGQVNVNGGILQITGNTLQSLTGRTINWDPSIGSFNGGLEIADPNNNFTISNAILVSNIIKTGPGTLTLAPTGGSNSYGSGLNINGGAVVLANTNAQNYQTITLGTSTLGTTTYSGHLVIPGDAGNLSSYRSALQSIYNAGAWTGSGYLPGNAYLSVTSGAASATRGIGMMTGAAYSALNGTSGGAAFAGGYTISATDMLFRFTFVGDADLNGRITPSDYAQLDSAFLFHTANPQWWNGDFNYDGVVDYNDYALIDASLAAQGTTTLASDMIATHTAMFGMPYVTALDAITGVPSAVPEPASLALLGLGALGLLKRRR